MKFCMTGQEQGDLLKQVTAWACLTIYIRQKIKPNSVRIRF
jgi:hypothetical protein